MNKLAKHFIAFTALATAAISATAENIPVHLSAARDIATHIAPEDNDYQYKDIYVHWKGIDGATKYENRSDCSGFFDLLLEHSYKITTAQLKSWTGHNRPTAAEWFDAIESKKAEPIVTKIESFEKISPGDVIVIKYQPGAQKDTGHVMIIDSIPQKHEATAPVIDNTTQYEVKVIDSSKSGHGPKDTRRKEDGTFSPGVGIGTFRLYLNADHSIAGYCWSTTKASKFEPISEHAVLLGQVVVGIDQ